ncbi:MAG: PAS domain S-box protein, partial [Alphaproteobacteria bacterium]|nr:PAS domain S-box protein [Alphaproteobacteria bacterium]
MRRTQARRSLNTFRTLTAPMRDRVLPSLRRCAALSQKLPMTEIPFDPDEFRSIVDSAPDAMVIVDGDGRICLVNRRVSALFGYAAEEMIGRPVEFLIPERYRDGHRGRRDSYRVQPRARPM